MILSRASVVGIDLGNEKTVVCMARNAKLEVISNLEGARKTPSICSFSGNQRIFGDAAKMEQVKNYKNTLKGFKRFLGKTREDPNLEEELKYATFAITNDEDDVKFACSYKGEDIKVDPVHATAMMLGHVKEMCEAVMNGQEMNDCCITCPPYWSDHERKLLVNAATIVGLNVVKLMNETSAVAGQYGMLRELPEDPIHVMFVDVGLTSYNVCIARLVKGEILIKASASDPKLGGRAVDLILFEHLVTVINEKYKLDVKSNKKACIKLQKQCERIKVVLSANQSTNYMLECFMEDKDVSGVVTRDELEKLCEPLLERMAEPILEVLESVGIASSTLSSVELVGGATKMPCLQKRLEEITGKPCSFTCDVDESVAKGAALQCGLLSTSLKMKDFTVEDTLPYAVDLCYESAPGGASDPKYDDESVMKSLQVFKRFNRLPSTKEIAIGSGYVNNFKLALRYSSPSDHTRQLCYRALNNPLLAAYECTGLQNKLNDLGDKVINGPSSGGKIKLRVHLDKHGVASISSPSFIIKTVAPVSVLEAPKKEGDSAEETKTKSENDEPEDNKDESSTKEKDEDKDKEKEDNSSTKEDEKKDVASKKSKNQKFDLELDGQNFSGLTPKESENIKVLEKEMKDLDNAIKATIGLKNELEGVILELMRSVGDEYQLRPYFSSDEEVENVRSTLMEAEDWLYMQDTEDEDLTSERTRTKYQNKLFDLKNLCSEQQACFDAHKDLKNTCSMLFDEASSIVSKTSQVLQVVKEKDSSKADSDASHVTAADEKDKIAETKPAVEEIPNVCAACGKVGSEGVKLVKCGNCKMVKYCNRECQRKGWAAHKKECKKIKAAAAAKTASATTATPATTIQATAEDEALRLKVNTLAKDTLEFLTSTEKSCEKETSLDAFKKAKDAVLEKSKSLEQEATPLLAKLKELVGKGGNDSAKAKEEEGTGKEDEKSGDKEAQEGTPLQIEMS